MKRSVFRLFAAVAVICLAVSCGGGDDDDGGGNGAYNFAGKWAIRMLVTQSNVPANDVGDVMIDVATVVQNGNAVTITLESTNPYLTLTGTCDPIAKTFTASGAGSGPITGASLTIAGVAVDTDSMTGNFQMNFPRGFYTNGTWNGDLASRSIAGTGSGAGDVRSVMIRAIQ